MSAIPVSPITFNRRCDREIRQYFDQFCPSFSPLIRDVFQAIVPSILLSGHRNSLLKALNITRTVSQFYSLQKNLGTTSPLAFTVEGIKTALSASAAVMVFFNPSASMIATSLTDCIENIEECRTHLAQKNKKEAVLSLSRAFIDLIFIASLGYATIELTVACLLFQATLETIETVNEASKGNKMKALSKAILACTHAFLFRVQRPILKWKLEAKPILKGTLTQNSLDPDSIYLSFPNGFLERLRSNYFLAGEAFLPKDHTFIRPLA